MATGMIKSKGNRLVVSIPANTYTTRAEAYAALRPSFNALSTVEKYNACIIDGGLIYKCSNTKGTFYADNIVSSSNKATVRQQYIRLDGKYYYNVEIAQDGTITYSNIASDNQSTDISLYVM